MKGCHILLNSLHKCNHTTITPHQAHEHFHLKALFGCLVQVSYHTLPFSEVLKITGVLAGAAGSLVTVGFAGIGMYDTFRIAPQLAKVSEKLDEVVKTCQASEKRADEREKSQNDREKLQNDREKARDDRETARDVREQRRDDRKWWF